MDVKAKSLVEGDTVLELRWQRTKIDCSMEEGMASRSYIGCKLRVSVREGGSYWCTAHFWDCTQRANHKGGRWKWLTWGQASADWRLGVCPVILQTCLASGEPKVVAVCKIMHEVPVVGKEWCQGGGQGVMSGWWARSGARVVGKE